MFPKYYYDVLNTLINVPKGRNERLLKAKSPYQDIELYKNRNHYWLALNNEMQFHTSEADVSHYYMVSLPTKAVRNPKSILIIGGGDGLPAKQALKHPYQNITNVELDGTLASLVQRHPVMRMISNNSFNSKRVNLQVQDGIEYLLDSDDTWDVIIDDCEVEVTKQPKAFQRKYKEYLKCLVNKLNPEGVACIMQPFEMWDDSNCPKHYRAKLKEILYKPRPSKDETKWAHYCVKEILRRSKEHMRDELKEWRASAGVPYLTYKIPVLPEIGPEMYTYLSKTPLKIPSVRGVSELRL